MPAAKLPAFRRRASTDAINGRLEYLRGVALGVRNLIHCIARSFLETGGFSPNTALDCEEPRAVSENAAVIKFQGYGFEAP